MNATTIAGAAVRAACPTTRVLLALALALCLHASAHAGVIHDESLDGDLSDDPFDPTEFILTQGHNEIIATSVSGDREYIALTVPVGLQLAQVILVSYDSIDDTAFIAVQAGDVMTEPPVGTDPANLLGWTHFGPGPGNVGMNILPAIGMGFDAIGFIPPLPDGTYTFWMQQTGENPATYHFDFVVVPAPGAVALLGLAGLATRRRRRHRLL